MKRLWERGRSGGVGMGGGRVEVGGWGCCVGKGGCGGEVVGRRERVWKDGRV